MKTTRIPHKNPCPVCGSNLDACTNVDGDHTPSEGDLSICVYCGTPLIFGKDLTVEVMPQDILDSPDCPEALLKMISILNKPDRGMKISLGWRKGPFRTH